MKNPLDDYNLRVSDYPNWKKGIIWGLIGGFIFSAVIFIPLFLMSNSPNVKSSAAEINREIFTAGAGAFLIAFISCGLLAAFRPPK
jgi:predicted cobalt transporter CbtA